MYKLALVGSRLELFDLKRDRGEWLSERIFEDKKGSSVCLSKDGDKLAYASEGIRILNTKTLENEKFISFAGGVRTKHVLRVQN